ncbi:MAG: hypothetical protein ACO394_11690, partial [Blastocatellia bacterium]
HRSTHEWSERGGQRPRRPDKQFAPSRRIESQSTPTRDLTIDRILATTHQILIDEYSSAD